VHHFCTGRGGSEEWGNLVRRRVIGDR
jgi:hypothetical protein